MKGKLTAIEGRIKDQEFVIPQSGALTMGRVSENHIVVVDLTSHAGIVHFSRKAMLTSLKIMVQPMGSRSTAKS